MRDRSKLLLIGLAYLSFVSLGLPDGLLGVAWPSIRASFDLPLDALGALLVMFTMGYLIASFTSGRLLTAMSVGTLLALSCLATAVSLIGYAIAPSWRAMVAFGILAGLGAGAIDAGLNTFAATRFSPRMVNWLHACYGIGAATGPALMTSVLALRQPWQRGYALVGGCQALLALCFGLTRRRWSDEDSDQSDAAPPPAASAFATLRLPVVWLSIAVFFVYTGVEAAAGAWAYTLFTESRGVSMMAAGPWVSVYWGALTIGRLLSGFVVGFVPVNRLLRYCIAGIAAGALLIWLNATNLTGFLGLALMGLASASVFPSLIATTPERLGEAHTANGVGVQIAAAALGQSLLPAFVGLLANKFGLEIIGPALFIAAITLLGLFEALTASSPKTAREAELTV